MPIPNTSGRSITAFPLGMHFHLLLTLQAGGELAP